MSEQVNLKKEIEKCKSIIKTMNNNLTLMTDQNTRTMYSDQIHQLENHIKFMESMQEE